MHQLLEELPKLYPSLEQKWAATHTTWVRKGDIIEVALSKAREQGPAVPECVVDERRKFQVMVREFCEGLENAIRHISSFDYGKPTSMYLPNPIDFG